MILHEAVKK